MDTDLEAEGNDLPTRRQGEIYESQSSYHSASSFPGDFQLYSLDLDRQDVLIEEDRLRRLQDLQVKAQPPFWDRLISW